MCRWNAYVGEPLVIGELLYRTRHGLIDQSLHVREPPWAGHQRSTVSARRLHSSRSVLVVAAGVLSSSSK
jgi:hypothetical protein